ncbi:MAG: hypothetical protein M3169_06790, partial [Candidatus Eremiobacteraeota bacterium]|nr:hypothetical protein [Candidatus Eremiobacteraeota bacterium]
AGQHDPNQIRREQQQRAVRELAVAQRCADSHDAEWGHKGDRNCRPADSRRYSRPNASVPGDRARRQRYAEIEEIRMTARDDLASRFWEANDKREQSRKDDGKRRTGD